MGALPKEPVAGARVGGKYVLQCRLATGGMGDIWIGRNQMTGADVALKILRHDIPDRKSLEPRFRHEARLGGMLSHRNIVRIFDLIEEPDQTLILVMELLRGEPLREFIHKRGALGADEAVAIAHAVLLGLDHAHRAGVIHRDITPANIFLAVDPDGHVTPKLLDFGIAKVQGSPAAAHTLDGRVLGTPRYMSPEQIRAEAVLDGRSDLFSVGTVLVELLTGTCPFAADVPSASLAAVLEVPVDPDPRIDPRLWLVLKQMLAKQAYERPTTAGAVAQALADAVGRDATALNAVLQDLRPSVRSLLTDPPPPSSPTQYSFAGTEPTTRRMRSVVLAAGVATAALLLFTAGVFYRAAMEHKPKVPTTEAQTEQTEMLDAAAAVVELTDPPVALSATAEPEPRPTPAHRNMTSSPQSRGESRTEKAPKKKKVAASPDF